MKVKMLVTITGTLNSEPWPDKGSIIDVPQVVADDLIANKYAEPAGAKAPSVESAAFDPVEETAAKPAAKTRKRTETVED